MQDAGDERGMKEKAKERLEEEEKGERGMVEGSRVGGDE